jgi:hypothetical protein
MYAAGVENNLYPAPWMESTDTGARPIMPIAKFKELPNKMQIRDESGKPAFEMQWQFAEIDTDRSYVMILSLTERVSIPRIHYDDWGDYLDAAITQDDMGPKRVMIGFYLDESRERSTLTLRDYLFDVENGERLIESLENLLDEELSAPSNLTRLVDIHFSHLFTSNGG